MKTIIHPFGRSLFLAALALLVGMTVNPVAVRAQAQAIDGTIEGLLRDPDANALADSGVQAVNKNTGYRREATTSEDGRYQIPLLPPGTYDVTVRSNGFAQLTLTVELNAGQTLTLDFDLSIGGVATQVEVTADTPVVEPGRTVTCRTLQLLKQIGSTNCDSNKTGDPEHDSTLHLPRRRT